MPESPRIGRPRAPGSDEIDAKIARLYQHHTVVEIAEKLELKPHQVQYSVNRQGLKKRRGKRRANPLEPIMRGTREWLVVLELWIDDDETARRRCGASAEQYSQTIARLNTVKNRLSAFVRVLGKEQKCRGEG